MRFFDNKLFSNSGEKVHILYSPTVNDDGTVSLVASGKEDIQSEIDSYRDECDINLLLARYAAGDVDALNQRFGSFGDFTDFPKTYAEALQLQINSKRYFDSLPVDVKEKFNNDANQFFAQTGSKDWTEIMSSMFSDASSKSDDIVIQKEERGEVKE